MGRKKHIEAEAMEILCLKQAISGTDKQTCGVMEVEGQRLGQ